jgi:hypothetical protein
MAPSVPETPSAGGKAAFRVGRIQAPLIAATPSADGNAKFRVATVTTTLNALNSVKIGYSGTYPRTDGYARSVMRGNAQDEGYRSQGNRIAPGGTGSSPGDNQSLNFYQRHPEVFSKLDQFLGYSYERSSSTIRDGRERDVSASVRIDSGLATSSFDPSRSMLKLGPLYFDVLGVGAGVLWTDYHGSPVYTQGFAKPGWAAFVETDVRVVGRLTDTLYIAAAGRFIYLPWVNRWGFEVGYGNGGPSAGLALLYADHCGPWDVSVHESFYGYTGLGYYLTEGALGFDQVGRYYFGIQGRGQINASLGDYAFWVNRVGVTARRPVFDGDWLLNFSADHLDFWQSYSFDGHASVDSAEIRLNYVGSNIPFAPYAFYRIADPDGLGQSLDILIHEFGVGFGGHLTDSLTWFGDAGLAFYSGSDSSRVGDIVWDMGFRHRINSKLTHALQFGQGIYSNNVFSRTVLADYINYSFEARLGRHSWGKVFAQYTQREVDLLTGVRDRNVQTGAVLSFDLTAYTRFEATVVYSKYLDATLKNSFEDSWIYGANLTQRLTPSLNANLFYRYEDDSGVGVGFREHVAGFSLRRLF